MADITTTPEEDLLIKQANTKALKNWLAECALAELKAADTIATNGIRILDAQQRTRLAELCSPEMPADGTIGYAMRRQEAINRMQAMRSIYLRDTIRHLKHCHKLIQLILGVMTLEQKLGWGEANERCGITGQGTTRANERLAVVNKFNELKSSLYQQKEAA